MKRSDMSVLFLLCVAALGALSLTTHVRRASAYGTSDGTFYVSPAGSDSNPGTVSQPFQTIEKAREAVRSLISGGMTSDVVVMLRGGRYYESSSITFDDQDSGVGGHKVVYTNYPGEEPIIIGGQKITGWTHDRAHVYKAYVGTSWTFNQLYENGVAETKARSDGYLTVTSPVGGGSTTSFHYTAGQAPSGAISSGTQAYAGSQVYIWSGYDWFSNTTPISTVDDTTHTVTLAHPTLNPITTGNRYYVQGFDAVLDKPGEWYLDGLGYVHYWPQHTPISDQEIVAPKVQNVFKIKGSSSTAQAKNITFQGLTFLGSEFTDNFNEIDDTWNNPADVNRNGIIYLENAAHNTVQDCKIIGAGFNGVELNYYSDHNTISGNEISQSGYFGVMLTGTDVGTIVSGAQVYDNHDNAVSDNYIHDSGKNVGNGGGLFLYQSGNNTIAHNIVDGAPRYGIGIKGKTYDTMTSDVSYGGIAVTWPNHWNFDTTRNNDIEYNDIENVNQDSEDSGIISLIGTGVANVIANNRLHDVHRAFGITQGIYLDDATDYTTVENNIVYALTGGGAAISGIYMKGVHNLIHNNVFVGTPDTNYGIRSNAYGGLRSDSNQVTNNILYNTNNVFFFDNFTPNYRFSNSDYNDLFNSAGSYPVSGLTGYGGGGGITDWTGWKAFSEYEPNLTYGSIAIDNTPSSSDKSLKFVDSNSTGGNGVSIVREFPATSDDVTYQFDVMGNQTTGGILADLLNSSGTSALSVGLSGDGHLRYWPAGGSYVNINTYSTSTWYTIKIVAHVSTQKFDIWVNGSQVVTNASFTNTVSAFEKAQIATGFGTGTFYVNNLQIGTAAEQFASDTFDEYASGNFPMFDEHSITNDPLFTSSSTNDYTLQSTSPALSNGFVDLDYGGMGLDSSYHLVRGVKAIQSGSSVVVSWNTVSGASSYVVRRTDDSGDGYISLGTSSSTSYTDNTALSGHTYYYTVAPVISSLEYPASNEVECDTTYAVSLINDTFDGETTGVSPAGYTLSTSAGTVAIANVPGSGDKSMELVDTNSSGTGVSATKSFTANAGVITYEVKARASQTSGGVSFDLYDGSGSAAVSLTMSGAGTLRYFLPTGGFNDIAGYNAGQWYTLRIVANVPAQVYDVYVDGSLQVQGATFENTVSSLSKIDVATGYSTGTYDVDYVTVSRQALVGDLFDAETTASSPAGYKLTAAAGSVAIANTPGSGNKSMELIDSDSSSTGVSAVKAFADQLGTVTCEVRVKASQTTGGGYIELDDDSGVPAIQIALSGDGHIRLWFSNGTVSTNIQTYAANTWYTLKVVANVSTHTYDFYVNGGTPAASAQTFDNPVDLIDRVSLSTGYATGTYDVDYVDVKND